MRTLDQLRNRHENNGIYYPDYISSSQPIRFTEDDNDDNTWVSFLIACNIQIRVFGYNIQDIRSLMIALEKCGFIAETRTTPSNFMFIRYHTQLDVEKALALNDTLIAGCYVGVVRCTSEEVGNATTSYLNQVQSQALDTRYV